MEKLHILKNLKMWLMAVKKIIDLEYRIKIF